MGKKVEMVGRRFGRWVVIEETDKRTSNGAIMYKCLCDCGNTKVVDGTILRRGDSLSCGCYNHDIITKMGNAVYKEKLYGVWGSMKGRCFNKNDPNYHNYGGRGITVCDEWANSYDSFKKWAYENGYEKGKWIDRIDNEKGYMPDNCRWCSPKEQQNNKRTNHNVEINGETHTVTEWAEISGINRGTLYSRVKKGWTGEKLICPVDKEIERVVSE